MNPSGKNNIEVLNLSFANWLNFNQVYSFNQTIVDQAGRIGYIMKTYWKTFYITQSIPELILTFYYDLSLF